MTDRPTEAELREIIAGTEGVTPGPWFSDSERSDEFDAYAVYSPEKRFGQPASICDTHNSGVVVLERDDDRPWDEQGRKDMAHIARCDPATIRAMASLALEALALREALKTVVGWREHDYPAHFDRWTAQYMADRARAALAAKEGN